jgi:hypothetical protein
MNLQAITSDYEASTRFFMECAERITSENIDTRFPGEWSARQCIHHVADSEAQSYARLRRLLAEPSPVIQGYDESAWADCAALGYDDLPIENSLAVFAAVRAASLDLIKRLEVSDLTKTGVHTESGPYSVEKWLATYARHPHEHGEQLLRALEGRA